MDRPTSLIAVIAAATSFFAAANCYSADADSAAIKAEVTKGHDESVKRLQDWIKQVSIAAEDRGYPEGADYMAMKKSPNTTMKNP